MIGTKPKVIVIGTSAGGMPALSKLLVKIPASLPAAILIVQHLSADSSAPFLVNRLSQYTKLTCKVATHLDTIEAGTVYLAPADRHLLLREKELLVVRGPRENQFRPSVDTLFRSAAAYYGSYATGVILTGFMSDGVGGMEFIKRCGGYTVVQHPDDAEFPALPENVIRHVDSDYVVSLDEMGKVLEEVVQQPAPDSKTVPSDIWQEAQMVERVMLRSTMTKIEDMEKVGERTPYTCPECGGGLWDLTRTGTLTRYRCYAGHAYNKESLLDGMSDQLEETLWVALRTLEERRNILVNISQSDINKGNSRWATMQEERAEEMKVHIERIRQLLAQTTLSDRKEAR